MDAAFAAITFHGKPHEYLTTPCHDPLETSLLESVDGANLAPPTYTVSGTHPIQATTPHPLSNIDDRSLRAVQDLCNRNDFVKPHVHSNVKKGVRGEAT